MILWGYRIQDQYTKKNCVSTNTKQSKNETGKQSNLQKHQKRIKHSAIHLIKGVKNIL